MMEGAPYRDDPIDAGWRSPPPTLLTYRDIIRRQAWLLIACLIASAVAGLAVIVEQDVTQLVRRLLLRGDVVVFVPCGSGSAANTACFMPKPWPRSTEQRL